MLAIQIAAAILPVTPSRRYEKKREGSLTVHQLPPVTRRTPAAARRSRARPGRSASHLAPPRATKRSGPTPGTSGSAPNAARTSAPTSNRVGPMQAPSQATTSPGRAARRRAHRRDRGLDDAAGKAAPAGVGGADGAPVGRGEQHRQAVGSLDDAGNARRGGDAGVGVMHRRARDGVGGADMDHAGTVHLAQVHRRRADRRGEVPSIGGDRIRVVADDDADVHRRIGAGAQAAGTAGHQRADAGDAPVGREPVGRDAHVASGQADGWVDAKAGSAMQASKTRITVGT